MKDSNNYLSTILLPCQGAPDQAATKLGKRKADAKLGGAKKGTAEFEFAGDRSGGGGLQDGGHGVALHSSCLRSRLLMQDLLLPLREPLLEPARARLAVVHAARLRSGLARPPENILRVQHVRHLRTQI